MDRLGQDGENKPFANVEVCNVQLSINKLQITRIMIIMTEIMHRFRISLVGAMNLSYNHELTSFLSWNFARYL